MKMMSATRSQKQLLDAGQRHVRFLDDRLMSSDSSLLTSGRNGFAQAMNRSRQRHGQGGEQVERVVHGSADSFS